MKPSCSRRTDHGLTLPEILVVVSLIVLLAALLLPILALSRIKTSRIGCVNNLKEISLGYRIWEGDNSDLYPMAVSSTNGGAMEQAAASNVAAVFQVMSNELSTPVLLICPQDTDHQPATNFTIGFSAKNISYFVGLDANEANPRMVLSGDDNFETNGIALNSGILTNPGHYFISWTEARHHRCGNVALTDGSVQTLTTSALRECSAFNTNRIAIP